MRFCKSPVRITCDKQCVHQCPQRLYQFNYLYICFYSIESQHYNYTCSCQLCSCRSGHNLTSLFHTRQCLRRKNKTMDNKNKQSLKCCKNVKGNCLQCLFQHYKTHFPFNKRTFLPTQMSVLL